MTWEKQIVLAGYKALALKHHPDKGGKDDDFKSLVGARDRLLELMSIKKWPEPVIVPMPMPVRPAQSPEELLTRILNIAEAFVNPRAKLRRR